MPEASRSDSSPVNNSSSPIFIRDRDRTDFSKRNHLRAAPAAAGLAAGGGAADGLADGRAAPLAFSGAGDGSFADVSTTEIGTSPSRPSWASTARLSGASSAPSWRSPVRLLAT